MIDFGVRPNKAAKLASRMAEIGIREADLTETFMRAGGKGGQNVTKVETLLLGKKSAKRQEQEKISRQKCKRSKRAKEKVLAVKKINSTKKANRQQGDATQSMYKPSCKHLHSRKKVPGQKECYRRHDHHDVPNGRIPVKSHQHNPV